MAVPHETYSRNFDRIFGVPEEDREEDLEVECDHCRCVNSVPAGEDFFVCVNCENRTRI